MPELPEVETTRRGILPHIEGRIIDDVTIHNRSLRWPVPRQFRSLVSGQRVRAVTRRAKYLLFHLPDGVFMLHLGMSGSLRLCAADEPRKKHDHVEFMIDSGSVLRFNDPRRFGSLLWLGSDPYQHALLKSLGPEPFDSTFDGDWLFARSRGRKVAIKSFIMDGKQVVGVGNIYANEALFLAGIRPGVAAGRVSKPRYQALATAIVNRLQASIEQGGTTLRDFVGSDGKPGYFKQSLYVYERQDQACKRCSTPIRHRQLNQRSTYYCPACQS